MTRQEILAAYNVNEHGIITSLGKFEGEMLYAPYFWDLSLDGNAEEIDEDDCLSYRMTVEDDDRIDFPELGETTKLLLWETEQGFVYCRAEN